MLRFSRPQHVVSDGNSVSFNPFLPQAVIVQSFDFEYSYLPPNNGAIDMIQSGKLVVSVLAKHCALLIMLIGSLLVMIWHHYVLKWSVHQLLKHVAEHYRGTYLAQSIQFQLEN
jgi:hypothetical protein